MTLDEAKRVRELLKERDALESDLQQIERCSSITGHINEGSNGLGFTWAAKDFGFRVEACREIQYLIDGYKADIAKIDATIAHLASPNFPTEE